MLKRMAMIGMMLAGMVTWGGCGSDSVTAIASATGLTATARILQDLGETTDREKALILANRQALEDELQAAQTDAQKAEVTAKIKENEKLQTVIEGLNTTVKLGEQAAQTNWSDPESAAPTITALILAGIAFWQRQSSKKKDARLDAKKAEINALKNGAKT